MQGDLALSSSSGLNAATVGSVSRLPHGARQPAPSCGFWFPKNQGLHGKSLFLQRRWPAISILGNQGLKQCVVKADLTASASTTPVAPLLLESPSGQFLAELLQSHPHLVSAAAEQQLETLAEARDAATSEQQPNTVATELVLYKRIAELRARERRKALEDIMYTLISKRFVEAGISLVPQMSSCPKNQRVDIWPAQDKELESVHSDEVFELIREHLALVLGGRGAPDSIDQNAMAQISKLRMGRVYAASVVYGYFLRRVDERFQLEKTMNVLPAGLIEVEQMGVQDTETDLKHNDLVAEVVPAITAIVLRGESKQDEDVWRASRIGVTSGHLRAYVMSFDTKTLQRYASVRSKESVSVIERHTEALFGKPEIQITQEGTVAIAKDEVIMLGFSGLRRLVLEAVAFGSFLWDVETFVDTHYHIVAR